MKIFASVAVSLDGYIDDRSPERLILSSEEDRAAVKKLRGEYDAILVGAETVRRDNPSLSSGNGNLIKVVVTQSGNLDPSSRFFTEGTGRKIVITGSKADMVKLNRLGQVSEVIGTGSEKVTPQDIIGALRERGVKKLFIEGGTQILTMFFEANAIDRLRYAVAPFFVGDSRAPRFVSDGRFPFGKDNRMTLQKVDRVGDMAVMEYALYCAADLLMLERAINLSKKAPRSETAYSVGAVIVTTNGTVFEGYSRETAPYNHAEEEAVIKAVRAGKPLEGATIYSSMEPCSTRRSKAVSCSELIIENKFGKVVFAVEEPDTFVVCNGRQMLENAGIDVLVIEELEEKAKEANHHLAK